MRKHTHGKKKPRAAMLLPRAPPRIAWNLSFNISVSDPLRTTFLDEVHIFKLTKKKKKVS